MQWLELVGSSIPERRMLALPVINHFDVLEDFWLGLLAGAFRPAQPVVNTAPGDFENPAQPLTENTA